MNSIIWKDVNGYEGLYKINENGDIFSIRNSIILKQSKDGRGYLSVNLSNNGIVKKFTIHRLVALAFLDIDLLRKEVNHIDGNKLNNYFRNLEWCTCEENNAHALKNNLNKSMLTNEDVLNIRYLLNNTNMTNVQISILYNISSQHVSKIKYNQRRKLHDDIL